MEGVTLRPATIADADALADLLDEGLKTYREFAGDDFDPGSPLERSLGFRRRLAEDGYWCLIALDESGSAVGEVAIMPASSHQVASDDPSLAHLSNLFVRTSRWGSGLATELHTRAMAEAASRGYTCIRLFTPADHARARRFYEREGWAAAAERFHEPAFGLDLVEYRRPLP